MELIHSSVCVRHGLIQFKVNHRLHLLRSKLSRIYQGADPTCPRYKQLPAYIYHMSCTQVEIFQTFSAIYNKIIERGGSVGLITNQRTAIAFSSSLARSLSLFNWIKVTPPAHKWWVEEVMAHLKLELLRFTLQGNTKRIYKVCQPFIFEFECEI